MPRFSFHMDDGLSIPDSEPLELADLAAARDMALRFVGQSLADRSADFWCRGEWRLTVSDEEGLTLFAIQVIATDAPSVQIAVVPDAAT